jgi:protocatechuate 3,4-dioxygenase beta subunit
MNFSYSDIPKGIFIGLILLVSCNNNPQNNIPPAGNVNDNTILLASEDEPGERLILNVAVTDKETGAPVPNTEVYFYQADTNGEYHPSNQADESTAKLSGIITSDDKGRFTVNTILPGEYEEPGNRHIHIHYARAEGYKQTGGVILFEDNVNDEVRKWANETGFGFIIDAKEADGILSGNLDLKLTPVNDRTEQ